MCIKWTGCNEKCDVKVFFFICECLSEKDQVHPSFMKSLSN